MGLKMYDIHTPSVPAGASSNQNESTKPLLDLFNDRDNMEAELSALGSVLKSHDVDMNTPLVTPDGFPRDDIDIPQITTTRRRIIRLRNDYKALMDKIEAGLHAHHAALQADEASAAASNISSNAGASNSLSSEAPQAHAFSGSSLEPPFAKVDNVLIPGPASDSGLKEGDEVRRFGTVNWTNHDRLTQVSEIVQKNEGKAILVKVKRKGTDGQSSELELRLTPQKNWGGRGLLGCHLVPL